MDYVSPACISHLGGEVGMLLKWNPRPCLLSFCLWFDSREEVIANTTDKEYSSSGSAQAPHIVDVGTNTACHTC